MKYFVARQKCRGSPLLRFRGKTQNFYIVDNDICLSKTKVTHYCIFKYLCIVDSNV